jgi:methylenetetrahydrofolate--tRNA-(uracil-5-)-methyltransferase
VPRGTALGSLVHYITHAQGNDFQPANITFDLLLPLEEPLRKQIRDKRERHRLQCERALALFAEWWQQQELFTGRVKTRSEMLLRRSPRPDRAEQQLS